MFHIHSSISLALASLTALGLLAAAPHAAQAQTPILVQNNGFEDGPPSGSTPPGWTYNGTSVDTNGGYYTGVQTVQFTGITGNQFGFIYATTGGYNLQQDITANGLNPGFATIAGDTYTLSVDVLTQDEGNPNGAYAVLGLSDGNGSYLSSPVQAKSAFTTFTTTFTALPGTSSKDLLLDLYLTDSTGAFGPQNTQGQANFDNIHLTQTSPVAAVPEASSMISLGALLALGGTVLCVRKRRASASA